MNAVIHFAVSVTFLAGMTSCSAIGAERGHAARDIVSARLSLTIEVNASPATREVTVVDEATIRTLVAHLPGVGTRRTPPGTSGWISFVQIILVRADGTEIRVQSDFKNWTDGHGDCEVDEGFEPFIRGLFP